MHSKLCKMKNFLITAILLITFSNSIFSQNVKAFFNDGIVYMKNLKLELKDTIYNKKLYKYPVNWNLKKGSDDKLISFPKNWKVQEGKDGHLVAFPSNWKLLVGSDLRLVPTLYQEEIINVKEKIKDCIVTETNDCMTTIEKKSNKYGFYSQIGPDGRLIIYTKDMNIAQSPDGRLVNLPKGWEISQNSKGRFSSYPKNWDTYILEEENEISMPKNWMIDPSTFSPKIITGDNFTKFIYSPVQKIELVKKIYEQDKLNGLDFAIYLLLND